MGLLNTTVFTHSRTSIHSGRTYAGRSSHRTTAQTPRSRRKTDAVQRVSHSADNQELHNRQQKRENMETNTEMTAKEARRILLKEIDVNKFMPQLNPEHAAQHKNNEKMSTKRTLEDD
ncbi:hypothetical protein WA026_013355 [Henosepilachna vigintioctopunctata]|uniref:Uncharacterized protein n=1 Tax=Henosepilachna vigintioctopunctata TaxID=420089 RepID=A0AAW1V7B4_9CUCU